jgi:hypothetical protein
MCGRYMGTLEENLREGRGGETCKKNDQYKQGQPKGRVKEPTETLRERDFNMQTASQQTVHCLAPIHTIESRVRPDHRSA